MEKRWICPLHSCECCWFPKFAFLAAIGLPKFIVSIICSNHRQFWFAGSPTAPKKPPTSTTHLSHYSTDNGNCPKMVWKIHALTLAPHHGRLALVRFQFVFLWVNQRCVFNNAVSGSACYSNKNCSQLSAKLSSWILHPAELGNSDVCKPKLPLNDAPCRWPFKVVLEVSVWPHFIAKSAVLTTTGPQRASLTGVGNRHGWANLVLSFLAIPERTNTSVPLLSARGET